jgi:flagellar hook-associated protein 1 FlgK
MGSFDGLQVSLSSLYAQRRGLDVTGQNIANASTDGYSRQRVVMASTGGSTVPALFSTWNGSSGGVSVVDVARMRDTFMDVRGRDAHATLEQAGVSQSTLSQIEGVLNEPSDTGLQSSLADLWAGFSDVANHPGDEAARSQLLQRASSVADWLHAANNAFSDQWAEGRTELSSLASEANTAASGVAELNGAIKRATLAGLPSNELADQRDQLAMKLSELTGATTRAGDDGTLDVFLGGNALVRGTVSEQLTTTGPAGMNDVDSTHQMGLAWSDDSTAVSGLGGMAAGFVQVLNTTIPNYAHRLDTVAMSVATAVNTQHAAGYDLDGGTGNPMFTGTGAADLAVAFTDPRKVAAGSSAGTLDGTNADALAALASKAGGPDSVYRQVVVDLGVEAQGVNRRVDVQTSVAADIDAARDSVAGVNMDEEMVNMLTFQRAYEGASRMLTAVDSMLDTLINRTGLVGR